MRNDNTLSFSEPLGFAYIEKTFNFFVYPTYWLDLAFLVQGSGYRDILTQRQLGKTGKNSVNFSRGCTVTVNSGVCLFKGYAGR